MVLDHRFLEPYTGLRNLSPRLAVAGMHSPLERSCHNACPDAELDDERADDGCF